MWDVDMRWQEDSTIDRPHRREKKKILKPEIYKLKLQSSSDHFIIFQTPRNLHNNKCTKYNIIIHSWNLFFRDILNFDDRLKIEASSSSHLISPRAHPIHRRIIRTKKKSELRRRTTCTWRHLKRFWQHLLKLHQWVVTETWSNEWDI